MKLKKITEDIKRVPKTDNGYIKDPKLISAYQDFDEKIPTMNCMDVIKDIYGPSNVTDDEQKINNNKLYVCRPWTSMFPFGMFSSMDEPLGSHGVVAIKDIHSKVPKDIAIAAHETFHALLFRQKKNYTNEHLVNKLTTNYLKTNFSGMTLHHMLEMINDSKISYKDHKYQPSSKFIEEVNDLRQSNS